MARLKPRLGHLLGMEWEIGRGGGALGLRGTVLTNVPGSESVGEVGAWGLGRLGTKGSLGCRSSLKRCVAMRGTSEKHFQWRAPPARHPPQWARPRRGHFKRFYAQMPGGLESEAHE